jgi:peptidyl-prolyl cis-trans isomerase B (cyclophilin B)
MVVHRVVPGFVAQLGAPFGDGFGGPEGKPALRCETSPLPFAPMTVGVALAGRDTGSSQIFVMQGRYPHLDGGYALIGTATGPWAALAEGDVIRKAKVGP